MPYRIYTRVNYAETWRDADDIHIDHLGFKQDLDAAMDVANDYIKNHFVHKDTKLAKHGKDYTATDFISFGKTVVVERLSE